MKMNLHDICDLCYDRNLITSRGTFGPFVAEVNGQIWVGDVDNATACDTIDEAISVARRALLEDAALDEAERYAEFDPYGNAAAEVAWHYDAILQLRALQALKAARGQA
jgi:hypothetical protein